MLVVLKLLLLLFSYKMLPVSFQALRGLSMSAVFVSHHRFLHKYDIADLFLNSRFYNYAVLNNILFHLIQHTV